MFKVSFTGNGYTSQERATDFALLRCAEVAKNNGFNYFAIVSDNTYSEESAYQQPTTSQSKSTVQGNSVRTTTTTYGGQTYLISKPRTANTILCFKERPDGIFYDVKYIIPSIRNKYGITQ